MFKLTIEQILASIAALSPEEKKEFEQRLPTVLESTASLASPQSGQVMTNTLGDVQLSGSNAAFNYQPSQAGRDVNLSTNVTQGSSEQQELLQALLILKTAIQSAEGLPDLSKIGAETQVDQLAAEAEKENPDKNLIGRTVAALKQGLQGVQELAGPVMTVASIVAKAWGIPV
ncbi:hypothetical protein HJG54_20850 [Leptolyngbya sp. NK1-12]|uniref:Uncharacterized protein n=1 Tax=Leptolyngbya sp. NK1-12 TaxID=2547451 RepID=A0AA96WF79_9CYAN|nr:hypothetical protein [Leptolyngbya sp. NK1-12]WNZ25057.1 hypothetical protein HJG54_20850 [Leptolyngbya sp. NK1-12]